MYGGNGEDFMRGGAGIDYLNGGAHDDTMFGGDGDKAAGLMRDHMMLQGKRLPLLLQNGDLLVLGSRSALVIRLTPWGDEVWSSQIQAYLADTNIVE